MKLHTGKKMAQHNVVICFAIMVMNKIYFKLFGLFRSFNTEKPKTQTTKNTKLGIGGLLPNTAYNFTVAVKLQGWLFFYSIDIATSLK